MGYACWFSGDLFGLNIMLEYEQKYWNLGIQHIAGIDEAGRGPLAGPVVASAVIFPQGVLIDGVNDSKKLTEKKREELFHYIHEKALAVGIGIVSHDVIDKINILQASFLAMNKALALLKIKPQQLLVDGNFFRHESYPVENIIKGDSLSHSIAAASIIAKVTRDALMVELHELYPQYGFAKHKGYGTKAHIEAIRQYGYSPIHRRSFHVDTLEQV
ncbi:MAG TPA: ribonuclease HII [Bacteroidetes bacterium]|nr:ribonuclease HII [Bacteroidota bacterium]